MFKSTKHDSGKQEFTIPNLRENIDASDLSNAFVTSKMAFVFVAASCVQKNLSPKNDLSFHVSFMV